MVRAEVPIPWRHAFEACFYLPGTSVCSECGGSKTRVIISSFMGTLTASSPDAGVLEVKTLSQSIPS